MLAIRTYCLIEQILIEYQWCSDTRLGAGMSLVRERGKQLRHGVRNNYSTYCWRRHWYPTPVLLPGKSYGQRGLVGCSPWGHKESDTTERLHFHFPALEKEMATHSSVLAWRIPGTVEPGELLSLGSHRVGHDWSDLAAAAAADSTKPWWFSWMF